MICYKFIQGLWYDYKLQIHLCPNNQLNFLMQTLTNPDKTFFHIPVKLYGQVPMRVFHWLREQMNEILVKFKIINNLYNLTSRIIHSTALA
jgi:hypothetical protein